MADMFVIVDSVRYVFTIFMMFITACQCQKPGPNLAMITSRDHRARGLLLVK